MTQLLPAAVLWDMDGTLIDTEPFWNIAEDRLAEQYGAVLTDDDRRAMTGMGLWDAAVVLQRAGITLGADEIVETLTQAVSDMLVPESMPWRPGALSLLEDLHAHNIPVALVTMSTRVLTEKILALLPVPAFQHLIVGDEVPNAKPHPDPYLMGAEALGVDIANCVALEDSINGLRAAWASGAVALGIPHLLSLDNTDSHALWPTLEGKTATDIAELFAAHRGPNSTATPGGANPS
ncbi:HAD-IA family hydrolase [Lysinibacter cavernae]|uniref:HAD superfamily hydrolase (TIGR01509 family) n=1 Tax=Lysinibacter cavernae TaxID=1640652 RepID=A0A7X5TT05_9MICO|nr:HAD superfamily hydrolase (TIGR01509 family) [Lysinibacter cavernae]